MWPFQKSVKKIDTPASKNSVEAFLRLLVDSSVELLGWKQVQDLIVQKFGEEMFPVESGQIQFWHVEEGEKSKSFKELASILIQKFEKNFGKEFTEKRIRYIFNSLQKEFQKENLFSVMDIIPDTYLEDEHIIYLSREALEAKVKEKTKELIEINKNLEKAVEERTQKLANLLADMEKQDKMLKENAEELTVANKRLKELDEIKSEFVSVAGHQLRTPLSGVKWTLDMIIKGDMGKVSKEQKEYLTKAKESNDRMIGIINDLLSVEKIQFGKYAYKWEEGIQIEELIKKIIFELHLLTEKKNVKIDLKDGGTPKITVDQGKIIEALNNLIENAVKYSNDGGKVFIETGVEGDNVKVSIKDNGIGVDKDQQKHLFERFFRASNAIQFISEGSGLGLFISKSIISQHDGSIEYKDNGQLPGSTFIVRLPVHNEKTSRYNSSKGGQNS